MAATTRTSTRRVRGLPRRSNSCSCSTRRSLGCSSSGMSPTSSRNSVPWSASSKRPIFCAMAPVKAPRSWPKSSVSSKPVGIAAQLILTKVRSRRRAQIVDGARDQLLAGAGFAADQDGRIGGRDGFHLLQQRLERGAFADDLLEVVLGADFVFKIKLLLGQAVLESGDLLEGQRIFDGDGDLGGDLVSRSMSCLAKAESRRLATLSVPRTRSRVIRGTQQTLRTPSASSSRDDI